MPENNVLTIAAVNIRGVNGLHKLKKIKSEFDNGRISVLFLAEVQNSTLPDHWLDYFPISKFETLFDPRNLGNIIVCKRDDFSAEPEIAQYDLGGTLIYNVIKLHDGTKICGFYRRPGQILEPQELQHLQQFNACMGDFNLYLSKDVAENPNKNQGATALQETLQDQGFYPIVREGTYQALGRSASSVSQDGPDHCWLNANLSYEATASTSGYYLADHKTIFLHLPINLETEIEPEVEENSEKSKVFYVDPDSLSYDQHQSLFEKYSKNLEPTIENLNKILYKIMWPRCMKVRTSKKESKYANDNILKRRLLKCKNQNERKQVLEDFIGNVDFSTAMDLINTAEVEMTVRERARLIERLQVSRRVSEKDEFDRIKTFLENNRALDKRSAEIQRCEARSNKRWWRKQLKNRNFTYFSKKEVKLAMKFMNTKCKGNDNASFNFLPKGGKNLEFLTACLNNLCYSNKRIPTKMKTSRLSLIPKPGKNKLRPICVGTLLSRLIDLILARRCTEMILENSRYKHCYAFLKRRNIDDFLETTLDQIRKNEKSRKKSAIIGKDLSAAYDSLNFHLLEKKMERMIKESKNKKYTVLLGYLCRWLGSRIITHGFGKIRPTQGIAQGSPWSPSLFVIYFDMEQDQPEQSKTFMLNKYADDSAVTVCGDSWAEVDRKIREYDEFYENWCTVNKLTSNRAKSEILCIKRNLKRSPVDENVLKLGIPIKEEIQLLGVVIDQNLTFGPQLSKIRSWLNKRQRILYGLRKLKMKTNLCKRVLLTFRSKIFHGGSWLWHIADSNFEKVEVSWRNSLRAAFGFIRAVKNEELYKATGIPSIGQYLKYFSTKKLAKSKIY